MSYGQQYFKNRKLTQQLDDMRDNNSVTIKDAESMGIKRSMIKKWEKQNKIHAIIFKGKYYYNLDIIKKLFVEELEKE